MKRIVYGSFSDLISITKKARKLGYSEFAMEPIESRFHILRGNTLGMYSVKDGDKSYSSDSSMMFYKFYKRKGVEMYKLELTKDEPI